MNTGIFFAPALAFVLFAGSADALTLTNRDADERHLRIMAVVDESADADEFAGSGIQNVALKAGQTMEILCDRGCTVVLESGDEENFTGYEVVVLRNGRLEIAE